MLASSGVQVVVQMCFTQQPKKHSFGCQRVLPPASSIGLFDALHGRPLDLISQQSSHQHCLSCLRRDDQQDGPALVHCLPACDRLLLVHLEAIPGTAQVQAPGDGDASPHGKVWAMLLAAGMFLKDLCCLSWQGLVQREHSSCVRMDGPLAAVWLDCSSMCSLEQGLSCDMWVPHHPKGSVFGYCAGQKQCCGGLQQPCQGATLQTAATYKTAVVSDTIAAQCG